MASPFLSFQMPSGMGQRKVQTNAMNAYRKQRQYIYRYCQLCHVTTSCAVIVGVCILMLPMLELVTERVQLTTTCYINHVPPPRMNFSHTPLELPSLNNVLPAMVLQNQLAWSNIKCPSYTSPHSSVCHTSLGSTLPSGLGRRVIEVVGLVVLLLLLMSGDIETNPGPLGEYIFLTYIVNCASLHSSCVQHCCSFPHMSEIRYMHPCFTVQKTS